MERWHTTIDTKEAASFAALGIEVRIQSSIFERTSSGEVRFLISPASACGSINTGKLRKSLRDGTLISLQPGHPLLTIRRAYQNRTSRLATLRDGASFTPVQVPHSGGVWQLVPSADGLPGLTPGIAAVRSTDLKLSVALETAGFPCIQIRGSRGQEEFTHAAFLPGAPAPFHDATHLVSEWRRDPQALPWELVFTRAMHGLHILQRLHEEVKAAIHNVIITKTPKTHAILRADSAPQAWDKARIFLGGGR